MTMAAVVRFHRAARPAHAPRQQLRCVIATWGKQWTRPLSSSSATSVREEFERKVALGKTLPPLTDNLKKLEMYALFKQAQLGRNTTPKPGMLDFVGKAKWEAWAKLGDMSAEEAMEKYMAIIDELAAHHGQASTASGEPAARSDASASEAGEAQDLLVTTSDNGLLTIQLNRPARYNALHVGMYNGIVEALERAKQQSDIKAVLFKSTGAMFSSGNDLAMFTADAATKSPEDLAAEGAKILDAFVTAFIQFPKPIVAAVQGPAVGIAVTILALCDLVYVSEKTTLQTPFTALGQTPEACSSVLFPFIMGKARANAMLLLGEKFTAREAVDAGLATQMFSAADFDAQVDSKVTRLLERYPNAMQQSKALIQSPAMRDFLTQVNRTECAVLEKLWIAPECMDAIIKFQTRKK